MLLVEWNDKVSSQAIIKHGASLAAANDACFLFVSSVTLTVV